MESFSTGAAPCGALDHPHCRATIPRRIERSLWRLTRAVLMVSCLLGGAVCATLVAAETHSASASLASPLSLGETLELASLDQPRVAALELSRQAALEAARAERELPDPKLTFGVRNLPVTGNESFELGREDMTMAGVGLMQQVVPRARRQAAAERMSAEADRMDAEARSAHRAIQRDAALAWLDVLEAQHRTTRYRQLAAELQAEHQVSTARLASGNVTASEVLRLDVSLASLRDRLIVAQRDEKRARAALSRWIGDHALRPLREELPETPQLASSDSGVGSQLDRHPALQAAAREVDVALREVDSARAERIPGWSWELMYGQRRNDRSDMVSLQVAFDLPWNQADRQDRRIAEKLAQAEAARRGVLDRRRELDADLRATRADLEASDARQAEYEQRLLPAARARLETARAAYSGATGALAEVWEARRALIEAQLEQERIRIERARSLTHLRYLVGETEDLP